MTVVKNDEAKIKTALKKHNIHIRFTLKMNFFLMIYNIVFVKYLVVFYRL